MNSAEDRSRFTAEPGPLVQENYPTAVGAPAFRVDLKPDRERIFVCPVGEVDLATAGELEEQIADLLDRGFTRLVVDLRAVTFLDSSAIRTLVISHQRASDLGATMSIILGRRATRRALELSGILDHLDVEPCADGDAGASRQREQPRLSSS